MSRWYVGLSDLKADLGITTTDQDAALGRAIERASRWLESATSRVFSPQYGARSFDAPDGPLLWLHDDLDTAAAVVDGSGTLAATSYVLYPYNSRPKAAIELVDGTSWTFGVTRRAAITVTGWWGYPASLEAVGTLALALAAGATSLTLAGCQVGWTLRIDDELLFVSAVSGSTVTVKRGQEGTTDAAHLLGASIQRVVVDAAAADAAAMAATAFFGARADPGIASKSLGSASISYGSNGAGGVPAEARSKALMLRRLV